MVGDEERVRIDAHAEVSLIIAALHHQHRIIIAQPGQELVLHAETGRAVAGTFLHARKLQHHPARVVRSYACFRACWPG